MNKDQVYQEVKARFCKSYSGFVNPHQACLYFAKIGIEVFQKKYDQKAIVQGGSMSWEIVPPELDDGISGTHFSFQWEPKYPLGFLLVQSLATGQLPEMHVWIALPDRNEIVDFTTGTFPTFVRDNLHMEWKAPNPPDYLWQSVGEHYPGAFYKATKEACLLANALVMDLKLNEL